MFSFIGQLSESRLYPSLQSLERLTTFQASDNVTLYICALHIITWEERQPRWAGGHCGLRYAADTVQWGDFNKWRVSSNDLYALLYLINTIDNPHVRLKVNDWPLSWLKDCSRSLGRHEVIHRMFMRLEYDLPVVDGSIKAIRRLSQDWDVLDKSKRKICLTSLIQKIKLKMPSAEILRILEALSVDENLNYKIDEEFEDITEDATAGATASASVATCVGAVGGIGAGFDSSPKGMAKSIYAQKKPEKKSLVIKRPMPITETKIEDVYIGRGETVEVYVDPSKADIAKIINNSKYGNYRGVLGNNLLVWCADEVNHDHINDSEIFGKLDGIHFQGDLLHIMLSNYGRNSEWPVNPETYDDFESDDEIETVFSADPLVKRAFGSIPATIPSYHRKNID